MELIISKREYTKAAKYVSECCGLWRSFIHRLVEELRINNSILPLYYQNKMGKSDARTIYKIKEDDYSITCACLCSLSDKDGLKDGRVSFYVARLDKTCSVHINVLEIDNDIMKLFDLASHEGFERCVDKVVNRLQNSIARYN